MAMPNLEVPQYPDVPNVAGVPPLFRDPDAPPQPDPTLDMSDGSDLPSTPIAPIWGIFNADGDKLAIADNIPGFDYHGSSRISDYIQEKGAFASYNKVQRPGEARVRMTKGGSLMDRQDFLEAIETAKQSTDLYSVVTPERTYPNVNVEEYSIHRETRNGATLLTVELVLLEIRQTGTAQFSQSADGTQAPMALPADQVQNPASADPVSLGQVQPSAPSPGLSALYGPALEVQ